MQKWQPHPLTVTGPASVVYIDRNDNIAELVLLAGEDHTLVPGTILAARQLKMKPAPEPAKPKPLAVRYWNWRTGKFWPVAAPKPPNPAIPNYFRIELTGDPANPKLEYHIHSLSII